MVHSEFQPNLNEQTTALLRVIIHTLDNATFGGQVPAIPQWTGPPHRIVQVQVILLASLSVSLLSALLAMLGKQWLNRCMPVDMRGTIIQRSQYRQRKLDGIINWYFDYVMESLPLMLQTALLLLGCTLSRYFWDINTTVASVVLGFTALGFLFYLFIVIAGAVSENCPYQTPGANFLRYIPVAISHAPILLHRSVQGVFRFIRLILHHIPDILRYIQDALQCVPNSFRHLYLIIDTPPPDPAIARWSITISVIMWGGVELENLFYDPKSTTPFRAFWGFLTIVIMPLWVIMDLCRAIIWPLVIFANWVRRARLEPHIEQITKQQTVAHVLDLRCILWTLQTSVDGPFHQSALEYLATMMLDNFNPTQFVASWFDIFLKCVQTTNGNVTIIQGSESLAEKSSLFCLHMLSHVVVAEPLPKAFEDVQQRFTGTFPPKTNFGDLSVSHTLGIIHGVFYPNRENKFLTEGPMRPLAPREVRRRVQWDNYQPSGGEHTIVAPALVNFAKFGYKRSGKPAKVPRWLLRFTLHSLSQDPLPPPSIVLDSLSIIAIDLGCYGVTATPLDQR